MTDIDPDEALPWLFDKQRNNISLNQFYALAGDQSYSRIAGTIIGGKVWVSTVWLGAGSKTTFETMVFPVEPDREDMGIGRSYKTEAQAMTGHLEIVEDVCQYLGLPVTSEYVKEDTHA